MLLFGHRFIDGESFYHVSDIDAILKTPPSSIIYLHFSEENLDIITYLQENAIRFALEVKNIQETIYAANLSASFIIITEEIAKEIQEIAETYLFDAKVVVHIDDEAKIEKYARLGVDGAVFPSAFVKVSS